MHPFDGGSLYKIAHYPNPATEKNKTKRGVKPGRHRHGGGFRPRPSWSRSQLSRGPLTHLSAEYFARPSELSEQRKDSQCSRRPRLFLVVHLGKNCGSHSNAERIIKHKSLGVIRKSIRYGDNSMPIAPQPIRHPKEQAGIGAITEPTYIIRRHHREKPFVFRRA
jgi:hypothetical protein